VLFVVERLQRGPVNRTVSTFPEVFGMVGMDRKAQRAGENLGFGNWRLESLVMVGAYLSTRVGKMLS